MRQGFSLHVIGFVAILLALLEPHGVVAQLDGPSEPPSVPEVEVSAENEAEPTVAPPEPTETPDEPEPTAEMAAPGDFSLMGAGDIDIGCTHTIGSPTSTFYIVVEDKPGDGDFVMTVTPYDLQWIKLDPITLTTTSITYADVEWRRIDVVITYSNGDPGTAGGTCNTDPQQSVITTQPMTEDHVEIPDEGWVEAGSIIYDTAALDPTIRTAGEGEYAAGGTVRYRLYEGRASCSGNVVFDSGLLSITDADNLPASGMTDPLPAGVYEWQVTYSGDTYNTAALSECGAETVIVGTAATSISTTMMTDDGAVIEQGGSVIGGTGVYDTATLSGATNNAGGTASNEGDDVLANNTDMRELQVLCPDIVVEKTASAAEMLVGDDVSFTITVTNIGEGRADNVEMADILPAGFNWTVLGDPAEMCSVRDGELVCTIDELAPQASVDIVVSGLSTLAVCGVVTNVVSVSASNEPDSAGDNNEASASVAVLCPPTETPVTPTETPVTPTETPVTPSETPVTPTETPVTPTETSVTPTETRTEPVESLPSTGTGSGTGGALASVWALIAAAVMAVLAAVALRRTMTHTGGREQA